MNPRRTCLFVAITVLGLLCALPARAQTNRAAKAHAEKGTREYNLGHFAEAIAAFEKAYEIDPAPILLFNIGQAHRQTGNNERATFFYRRYLEQAPNAPNRAQVEKRMHELDEIIDKQNELKRRPPPSVEPLSESASDTTGSTQPRSPNPAAPAPPLAVPTPPARPAAAGTSAPEEQVVATPRSEEAFRRFAVGADAGLRLPHFAGRTIDQPTMLVVRLRGTYRVSLGSVVADFGLAASVSQLPYVNVKTSAEDSSLLTGLMATAGIAYPMTTHLHLAGDIAAGVVWWSGLGDGDPFTLDNAGATGAIPMPSVGISGGVAYDLPRGFYLSGRLAYSFTKTTSAALTSSVSSISALDLAAGGGVRF